MFAAAPSGTHSLTHSLTYLLVYWADYIALSLDHMRGVLSPLLQDIPIHERPIRRQQDLCNTTDHHFLCYQY
jgi:hypothetical protein